MFDASHSTPQIGPHTGQAFGSASSSPSWLESTRLAAVLPPGAARNALIDAALPPRVIRPHAELLREGEAADHLHVLLDGWACRYRAARDGTRQIVALLLPGDVACPGAALGEPDGCGVRALTAARVVSIPRARLAALMQVHPAIERALFRLALADNAGLARWLLCLGRGSAVQRLSHLLCELAVRMVGDGHREAQFPLPLTQEQLGDVLGLTSVHVNRTMQQLRQEELVVIAGRTATLPDLPRLRFRAEFEPAYLNLGAMPADDGLSLDPAVRRATPHDVPRPVQEMPLCRN